MLPSKCSSIAEFLFKNPEISPKQIAERFGVSVSYVYMIRSQSGQSRPRSSVSDKDICSFVSENPFATYPQIAEALGVSYGTISYRMRRLGLDRQAKEAASSEVIISLAKEKPWLSSFDIAHEAGVTVAAVKRVLREAGLRGIRGYKKREGGRKKKGGDAQ